MFKKNKLVKLTVLVCAFSACLAGACVAKTDAYVAEATNEPFYMVGATIRIGKNADDANGLRFGANVDVSLVEEVQKDEDKSFGVLIFPYDEMTEAGLTTTYDASYDYYAEILKTDYAKTYAPIMLDSEPVAIYNATDVTKIDYYELRGSITNILYDNSNREFFGVGYIKDVSSGTAEYTYAYFDNEINVRSMSYIASAAYNDTKENYSVEEKGVMKKYFNRAYYKTLGVEENEIGEYPNEMDSALTAGNVTLRVGQTYSFGCNPFVTVGENNVDMNLFVKWTSNNTNVASVDENGTVSAKTAGVATITARYMDFEKAINVYCTETAADYQGWYFLTPDNALLTETSLNENATVTLDSTTESVAWYNLPSYFKSYLAYTSDIGGVLTLNYNGTSKDITYENTGGAVAYVGLTPESAGVQSAESFVKISIKSGSLSVNNVALGRYANGAECVHFNKTSMLTCATAATSDYPAYTNFSNKSVTLTANSTGNQIVFVGASNAEVKYTVEYNGRSYSGGFVGTGWGKFYGINLPTETISKGSEISVKIDGNVNLNAAYIVDTQEYAVSTEITQKELFNNLKGVYLYPEQGALTNTKLVDGEVTLDAVGESITWYNLPTYKEIIVVYKAETAGTLKAYYGNNWKSSYAFPVNATNGEYQTVKLWLSSNLSTATPTLAGQSLKIVFETGNVAATIKEVVLSYYFHAETGEVTNFGDNSSIFTPDTAAKSDYPAYTAVYGNTALNLTVAQDTNKILIVATSQMEVEYVVNYNGFLFRKITPASSWNASGYGITEINTCLIPAGSTIIVTPLMTANITAIYAVNTIDYGYVGMPLEAKNAEMVGTELKVDDAVRLDTVGESLTWRNLPSYKSIAVVYRAEENGVISVNYNGKNYEMAVVNTLGAYQVAFAYVDTTTAGGFLTISYQKGNAAVAVQTVVLGGYSTGAECPAFASEPVWLGTGGGSSYPVYDNFNNTSLNVSLTKDGKALAFVCASASGNLLSFTFTIEGTTYTKSVVGQGWDRFFIVYVETAPLASGTQITVQVGGNVNLNAVYAL